jgi:hypothetical protein
LIGSSARIIAGEDEIVRLNKPIPSDRIGVASNGTNFKLGNIIRKNIDTASNIVKEYVNDPKLGTYLLKITL